MDPGDTLSRQTLILVVDADPARVAACSQALQGAGCGVVTASNIAEAQAAFDRRLPDAVLFAPDCAALCGDLHGRDSRRSVPFFVAAHAGDCDAIRRAYVAGASDVVSFPLDYSLLVPRIRRAVEACESVDEMKRRQTTLTNAQRIAHVGAWEWNTETDEMLWSAEAYRILGLEPDGDKVTFQKLREAVHPEDRDDVEEQIREGLSSGNGFEVEHRLQLNEDDIRYVQQRGELVGEDSRPGLWASGVIQDVTEQRTAQDKMSYLANFDALTGLSNRRLFKERLNEAIARARDKGHSMALLFLDLDRFKRINDTLGHTAGDEMLRVVADRLREHVRGSDMVARHKAGSDGADSPVSRLGGDEFTVLLSRVNDPAQAGEVAGRILGALPEPFEVEGHTISPTGSIGIAVYPLDGQDGETLLKNADTAMYHAKEKRRNSFHFFSPAMNATLLRKLTLESRLREALGNEELRLHYQPRVDLASNQVVGMEALLRWSHPELGVVSPREFIPVTEEAGLITEIGRWVLDVACKQAKAWQDEGYERSLLSVNVSARQFAYQDVTAEVVAALTNSGLDPDCLELEITESVLIRDDDAIAAVLRDVRAMGVRISLDDFGTGYSSLSYITRFPLDTLKMDKNFIRDVASDRAALGVVTAVIDMAHCLDLTVVAEGVDEEAQAEILRGKGCDEMQGFLYSGALPPDQIPRHLRKRSDSDPT
jgi:diguanylate cyclase (GGDEF)-like protein